MNENIAELHRAPEALKEGEAILQYIVRHDPSALAIFDCNMNYLAVSDRFLLDYNVKETTIIGRNHYEVFPEIPQRWKDIHQRCLKGEILSNEDDFFERPDGTITYNRWECRPFYRINGEIGGMITYTEVTTEKKLAEMALKENEKKYRYLFLNNPQPMWLYDLTRHAFIEVNDAAVKDHGYTREEFLQMTLKDINPSDEVYQLIKAIEQGEAFNSSGEVIKHTRKNGEPLYAEIIPYLVKSNGVDACHILIKDITRRKLAEEAMHDSEARYRAFFENSMDAILLTCPDGSIVSANQAACNMFGYLEQELISLGRTGIVDTTDPRLPLFLNERRLKGKAQGELTLIHKNGSRLSIEISSTLFMDHEGLECAHIIIRDITEKKKAQNEIKFQADLLNHIGQAAIALNHEQEVIYWNKTAEKIYGWTESEVMGKNAIKLLPSDMTHEVYLRIYNELRNGNTFSTELMIQRKDGSQLHANVTVAPLFDTDGKLMGVIGISSDITERKQTEETLRKLSSAVEQTIDEVMITDRDGKIEYVNKSFETITGYTLDEVIGKTPRLLKSGKHDSEYYEGLWQTIRSGKVYRAEMVNKAKNGKLYCVEKTISPIVDKKNQITHFISTAIEISARKQAEQELIKSKEKAEESDRLKSAFLANMSHEVRTPLNSIIGFSSLLMDPDFNKDQKDEFIGQVIKNGNALLNLINDILDISKIEAGEMVIQNRPVNLRKFINSIHQQFSFQVKEKTLDFILTLPCEVKKTVVLADPNRLTQVFINLISNAMKFTHQGRIEIGYQVSEHEVKCYVSDTGIGISVGYQEKIFERFRQVEGEKTRKYGGNGLGLAITKNLVELMGGRIGLESKPGKGSVFYFTLPKVEE